MQEVIPTDGLSAHYIHPDLDKFANEVIRRKKSRVDIPKTDATIH